VLRTPLASVVSKTVVELEELGDSVVDGVGVTVDSTTEDPTVFEVDCKIVAVLDFPTERLVTTVGLMIGAVLVVTFVVCGVLEGVELGVLDGVELGVLDGVELGVLDGVELGVLDGVELGVLEGGLLEGTVEEVDDDEVGTEDEVGELEGLLDAGDEEDGLEVVFESALLASSISFVTIAALSLCR
jgi:hypothetical protein